MHRKKLIAIGCSYTEHAQLNINKKKTYPFDVWPMHLANKLDMECINLGQGGAGNEYISAKLIDSIFLNRKEDIGLVVLMWSGWPRIDFQDIKGEWGGKWRKSAHTNDKYFDFWGVDNNAYHMTMKSLRHFLIAQILLKDISYLMIQGVLHIHRCVGETGRPSRIRERNDKRHGVRALHINAVKNRRLVVQTFINSKIFYEINEDKFIGWPIMSEIGGYNVENILDKLDPEGKELRISSENHHPNAEGHKIIAQELYNAYAKIYT